MRDRDTDITKSCHMNLCAVIFLSLRLPERSKMGGSTKGGATCSYLTGGIFPFVI